MTGPITVAVPSPLGELLVEGDEHAVTAILFPAADDAPPRNTVAGRTGGAGPWPADATGVPAPLAEAARQLGEYFEGRRTRFDLPLAPARGGAFDRAVWAALAQIPYGATRSYGDVARAIGRPTSVRAVGAANGRNPIPIVVPCHRVIGADGTLTGFGGGLDAKRRLLDLETHGAIQTALL